MSQVTQGLVDEFRRAIVLNRRPAYTFNEFEQLLWAWEELQRVRTSIERGVFRGLKTGEGPQEDAATSPDVLSRQSPVEADTQRSTPDRKFQKLLAEAVVLMEQNDFATLSHVPKFRAALKEAGIDSLTEREFEEARYDRKF